VAEATRRPDFKVRFLEGIGHFNAREFWEAHESWEELWLASRSDAEQFLQGMIQLAAAYHHVQRGTLRGAVRLFDAALGRLGSFPLDYCGIERELLEAAARRHREWAAAAVSEATESGAPAVAFDSGGYPEIAVLNPAGIPPRLDW
jgi:predicted metal-dependent hydrolase